MSKPLNIIDEGLNLQKIALLPRETLLAERDIKICEYRERAPFAEGTLRIYENNTEITKVFINNCDVTSLFDPDELAEFLE